MAGTANIIGSLQKLQGLPEDLHWFCPRRGGDASSLYFAEDLQSQSPENGGQETFVTEIQEARSRQTLLLDALQIFAFDGPDASQYQEWLRDNLANQMRSCDICIREYYRGRRDLKQRLLDTYDEQDVQSFLEKIDQINRDRIEEGLDAATAQLAALPPESRNLGKLDTSSVYSIFESFSCAAFYKDELALQKHFDDPFALVQTNRLLKMSSLAPGVTYFLFNSNKIRSLWAEKSFQRHKRDLTQLEFEWDIKDALLHAMRRVQLHNLDQGFLPQFWKGVKIVIRKLNKSLITHELRALDGGSFDADICSLALHHLQVNSEAFPDLLATIQYILEVSPADFWEAMGSIPPTTWIEQFFGSPSFKRIAQGSGDGPSEELSSSQTSLFSWFIPFLESLKPMTQPAVCRGLIHSLLGSLQSEEFPVKIRNHCFRLAIEILNTTLRSVNGDRNSLTSNAITTEMFDILNNYSDRVIGCANQDSNLNDLCSDFVRQALTLECGCVIASADSLTHTEATQKSVPVCHRDLWKRASKQLSGSNVILARNILLSIWRLTGIEEFVTRQGQQLPTTLAKFNESFKEINNFITYILEQINNFDPNNLQHFFNQGPESIQATVMLLLSSDSSVRAGGAEIIKTLSDKLTRGEAVDFILREHLVEVLGGFAISFRQIAARKAFQPTHGMLKLCTDVLNTLCNSQNGILRVRSEALAKGEGRAVEHFWLSLWRVLRMIFSTTETWSYIGHDKKLLMDFCRDTMEFAEKVIDQFGVVSGALRDLESNETAGKRLIEPTRYAMGSIVKWLKLRDDFLVAKSCALVCKVLVRLKEFETALDSEPTEFVEQVIFGKMRTMLTHQQKAELQRALATHTGHDIDQLMPQQEERSTKTLKKNGIDLEKWKMRSKNTPTPPPGEKNTMKKLIAEQSKSVEAFKSSQLSKIQPAALKSKVTAPIGSEEFRRRRQKDMEEKKKRDAAAIEARRQAANGGVGTATALNGLGVLGKVHDSAPKGSGMMVSSDESSDDSEEDFDEQLFRANKKGVESNDSALSLTEEQARALRRDRPQGPVKKKRLQRSAKDMRARLTPDLSALHKSLFSWDYFHDDVFPPRTNPEQYTSVLSTFRDVHDYQRTFNPLLILEAWNGFLKAREENTARPFKNSIVSRSNVDAFIEISTTIAHDSVKDISEGDLVLLSRSESPTNVNSPYHEQNCMSRISRISRKKAHVEILYKALPGTSIAQQMSPGGTLFGLKLMSLVPLEREYGALYGLEFFDLCDEICKAKPSPLLNYSNDTLQPFMQNYNVNRAQAKAIKSAIDNDAFTLIQGPPGSGKTKTIVAIVGALLSDSIQDKGTMITRPQAHAQTQVSSTPKKMLVCAPSNAAVDELVMRFKEGVKTLAGREQKISVVRLGRSDAINSNVQDVTLDEMVNKRLNLNPVGEKPFEQTQKLMEDHREVSAKLREARAKLDEAENTQQPTKDLREAFEALRRNKSMLSSKIDQAKDNENTQSRQADIDRRKAQQEIVNEAHVLCATLSGSGHEMFANLNVEFETVVIDEAAQCVELSALIPLKYGCAKCVLVGDPQQLPPTVFSKEAARFKYEQSIFVRMQENHPDHVHLLDTQYRMHPDISAFPSRAFYDGRLLDGNDMASLRTKPWHSNPILGPFRFFDVQGQHQAAPKGHSLINLAEIRIALRLYERLTSDFTNLDFSGKIGIITPYKSQLRELKEHFQGSYGSKILDAIEFNTTDAFQGRESEIIIFSCVRASPQGGIGFLQDIRRMNVGLTRAKSSLWVLGNSQSLSKGEYWSKLVEHAKESNNYSDGELEAMLRAPLKMSKSKANESQQRRLANVENVEFPKAASSMKGYSSRMEDISSDDASMNKKRKRSAGEEVKQEQLEHSKPSPFASRASSKKHQPAPELKDIEMVDAPPISSGLDGKASARDGMNSAKSHKNEDEKRGKTQPRSVPPQRRAPSSGIFLPKKNRR